MKIRRKTRQNNPGTIRTVILTLCTIFFALIVFGTICLICSSISIANSLPDVSNARLFNLSQKSTIYAADGKTVLAELQLVNRDPLSSLDQISQDVIDGTIATEDAKFYSHKGVDIIGMGRAFVVNAIGGETQGGSTITMQLMRNTILTKEAQEISIERKISEIILALNMEEHYSKDEILLMYLNTINYGDGCYGIEAAAKHYFSKSAKELTLAESATLIGIPQSPSYLSPTINIDACTTRRNVVLNRMYNTGCISEQEKVEATSQPIVLNVSNPELNTKNEYPYFTSYVKDKLLDEYTSAEIFEGGWQVYTTLEVKDQIAAEEGCKKNNARLESGAESVAVSVDQNNGFITSMVGGSDFNQNQFNIAAQKGRPTGSSFKAFTLVTAILQGYNPSSYTLNCSSPMYLNGTRIENFGNTSYGTKTIQGATAVSSNTGFVRLQETVTTDAVIETAKKLGIKDANLPSVATLTLGVADITPLEMATAYATIANGGTYHAPTAIKKIVDCNDNLVYEFDEDVDGVGTRVIAEDVAAAATKVLKTVFTSGTATSAQLSGSRPVAGKTGTSEDYRDHTLIGYTTSKVLATWIGKRDYTPTSSSVSCNYLFKTIMDQMMEGVAVEDFPEIADPQYTHSGKEKGEDYDSQGNNLRNAPNVVGQDLTTARSLLANYDISVYQIYSSDTQKGKVISQSVQNNRIILYVSKGADPSK